MSILSDIYKLNEDNEEINLDNKSKYPNLFEYQSIPENNNYFIFPIQMTNSYSFPECENIAKIYENLTEEIGLFNIYKEINYDLALQKEFSTSMFSFEASIDQKEFYNDLIYLLQGIPTSTFSNSDKFPFFFIYNENSNTNNIRFIGTLPGMTNDILKKFINFGTKMQLLQFLIKKYLFDIDYRNKTSNISPFFENFFRGMNELFIKINEKLIFYKKLITEENFTMLTLYNKVKSLSQIINVIYILFNLKDQKLLDEFKGNNLEEFFEYYNSDNNNNNFKKINLFLDMLLKVYFTFYNKDKIFYIIKHILLSSLHSYLYYIINLLFTGTSTDDSGEHFILTSNNNNESNISLDTKKLPQFLLDYKRPLLNNTILTKYIKKFDQNYYNMLTYNLKDFIEYINNINIRDFSIDTLNNFKAFKEEIYKKKLQLMDEVNKQVIYLQELKENEINLKNIKKIKEIKNYFSDFEKEEIKRKKRIKEKKEKYYNELKEQILGKKRKIEEEIKKLKNEEIEQKEKERIEKENEKKFIHLMKLKYKEIQEKTRDIQIFGSLINKWIFQRNQLNEKRQKYFENIYRDNYESNVDEIYPKIEIINNIDENIPKKNYHKTYEEQLEFIKNQFIPNDEEPEDLNINKKQVYNNSDNVKQIFNQIEEKKNDGNINENNKEDKINNDKNNNEVKDINNENKEDNKEKNQNKVEENINKEDEKNNCIKNENTEDNKEQNKTEDNINEENEQEKEKTINNEEVKEQNDENINIENDINNKNNDEKKENSQKQNDENLNKENEQEIEENKQIDINDIRLDISGNENNKENNIKDEEIKNLEEKNIKKEEKTKMVYDNKNKYLQNLNLFPEKGIPEDTEALYKLTTLINSEDEDNNENIINNDIINKKSKNKQIPIQLIIKEFFHDIIMKQNAITNQTFVLMLKNKFGLMHHFDFFNSIILCNKGNLILQYIESIFDFKTLTLNTSDPDFLTNELRSLVKLEYENNVKSLYLNSLLESLKFKRLSDLNLNYAINNIELNFKLEYAAAPPVDVIFNNSNNDAYDKIFKKLLKFNIYNQIGVKIYQMLKNARNSSARKNINKIKMKKSDLNDDDELNEDSFHEELYKNDIFNIKLVKLFNKSFKIFKGILSYLYQQIIQKVWMEMEKKIESSLEVFQIIKYHYEALKNITNFFKNNLLITYFENLCNDLAQLYLQIMVSDYYDKQQEKTDFLEEIIEKLKEDNRTIINFRDSIGDLSLYFPLKSYL